MKRIILILILLLSLCCLTSNLRRVKHDDPFYNYDDMSILRIPLIKPIEVNRLDSSYPWDIELHSDMWIDFSEMPEREYCFFEITAPEKFAVQKGVIMAYSSYVDKEADAYIQENFFHWFVIIPEKEFAEGFHTEDEFLEYIQILGIEDPDWQIPDEAHKQFRKTGCLEWIPDCK